MKSFIVTGASACGKTTLINEAIKLGYHCLPTHTTRNQRLDEVNGIHNIFIDKESYEINFLNKLYLEPTLEYAENYGVYYGTPISWLECLSRDNYCGIAITPLIAEKIHRASGVLWVSLTCDDNARKKRLIARGIDEQELNARLNTTKDHFIVPSYVRVFDTTNHLPTEILSEIINKTD